MSTYKFGKQDREHRFCGICGSSVCIDFLGNWIGDVVGMNVSFFFFFPPLGFFLPDFNFSIRPRIIHVYYRKLMYGWVCLFFRSDCSTGWISTG